MFSLNIPDYSRIRFFFIILSIYLSCHINNISADCPDKLLYCFDSKEIRNGGIIVNKI